MLCWVHWHLSAGYNCSSTWPALLWLGPNLSAWRVWTNLCWARPCCQEFYISSCPGSAGLEKVFRTAKGGGTENEETKDSGAPGHSELKYI